MKRQMKAKTLNSVERISKIKSEIAAMECNRSVAAVFYEKGAATHGNLKAKASPCQRGAKYCRCAGGAY